jgi:hypothetical protein
MVCDGVTVTVKPSESVPRAICHFRSKMNTEIRHLIKSGKKIALARLEIDGEHKRLGYGELAFDDQTIVLTMIGNKATSVDLTATAARLRLAQDTVALGLNSWERVRDTLAHGIFQRAHQSLVHPRKPARPANENIVHDLSRISGLFHAIILKEANTGPFALSILEDKDGHILKCGKP